MKLPSVYLKMRVLGAVDTVAGKTRDERMHAVAAMTFTDEDGNNRQFTWRTIQTWFYRYKNRGITGMTAHTRKDKGHTRKVTPEELLEAIHAAKPHFRSLNANKRAIYRFCVEKGLLHPDRIAQTTFYRFIREYDLLAEDEADHKQRLAFSMKHANQLWQADTLFGPHCATPTGTKKPTKLIAFLDDASRVLCHGEFFFDETIDTLVKTLRAASTNAASPSNSSSTTDPSTAPRKSHSSAPASDPSCVTRPSATPPPKEKSNASSAASAISSSSKTSISPRSTRSTDSSPTGPNATTTPPNTMPSA